VFSSLPACCTGWLKHCSTQSACVCFQAGLFRQNVLGSIAAPLPPGDILEEKRLEESMPTSYRKCPRISPVIKEPLKNGRPDKHSRRMPSTSLGYWRHIRNATAMPDVVREK